MSDERATSYGVSESMREQYYRDGYWCDDDFWTSFEAVAAKFPERIAIVDRDRTISFAELRRQAVIFAASAGEWGLRSGEVVIIHGRHCIEAVVTILGCAYGGMVPALLPAMFSVEQILGIVEHTGSRLILGVGEEKELGRALQAAQQGGISCLIPDDADWQGKSIRWSDFNSASPSPGEHRTSMNSDELLLLIFSSGTTGAPKGVMHSSNTTRFAVRTYADIHGIDQSDTILVVTAFGFVGSSLLGFYLSLLTGCTSVLMRNWSPEETLGYIARYKINHFLLMPTHAIDILSCPTLDQTDCSSVTRGVIAGVAEEYRLDARQRLCAMPFPMYGMSESPAHVTGRLSDDWEELRTTEGRPLPGTEVLICDDDGNPLPCGETGNILVRGPNRFLGYYKAPELNEGAISEDGYFRTGDIGFFNTAGYMTFMTRSKDIIRRGGVTITPADIELAIRSHPKISDVAVIGLPDPRLGERACACLITRDNDQVTLDEVTAYLTEKGVARYLWPESVQLCQDFPRTPSLKVQKNQLKALILERIAAADGQANDQING